MSGPRHPRHEATSILPDGYEARVLEPSPPAVAEPPWFADDPTDRADASGGVTIVSPTSDGDLTWDDHVAAHPEHEPFARRRRLLSDGRPPAVGEAFARTREELHRLAAYVVSPARERVIGKIGLRWTLDGFGTPFFGADEQIRVEGTALVSQVGDPTTGPARVSVDAITTIRAAADLVGIDVPTTDHGSPDVPRLGDVDRRLEIDPAAAEVLAAWYGWAVHALEEARRLGAPEDEVTRVQIWPEHFDPAFEMGAQAAGARASYGASPGDEHHAEPYVYVAAWSPIDRADPFWNDPHFNGASLGLAELRAAADPKARALAFWREGYRRLTGRREG